MRHLCDASCNVFGRTSLEQLPVVPHGALELEICYLHAYTANKQVFRGGEIENVNKSEFLFSRNKKLLFHFLAIKKKSVQQDGFFPFRALKFMTLRENDYILVCVKISHLVLEFLFGILH